MIDSTDNNHTEAEVFPQQLVTVPDQKYVFDDNLSLLSSSVKKFDGPRIILKIIEILESNCLEHLQKYLFLLKTFIQCDFVETKDIQDLIDNIDENSRMMRKHRIRSSLQILLNLIRPVDNELLLTSLRQNMLTSDVIKGNDVVLLIGFTGAGKSTLIHFLAGAKMTESVIDGTHHIHPVMPHHRDELKLFVTSYIPKSETRALRAIELREEEIPVWLVDCPGFEDTDGAEIDISNGLSISSAVKRTRSVRVVVAVSEKGLGDRLQGVESLIKILMRFADLSTAQVLESFTFIFTKFKKSDGARISSLFQQKLNNLSSEEANSDIFCDILATMVEKASNSVLINDPLHDDPKDLISTILQTPSINSPEIIFKDFVTQKSLERLKSQLSLDSRCVYLKIRQLEDAHNPDAIENAIQAMAVKVAHLEEYSRLIRLHDCETAFSESKSEIERYTRREVESFRTAIGDFHHHHHHHHHGEVDVVNPSNNRSVTQSIALQLYAILCLDYSVSFIHVRDTCLTALSSAVNSIRTAIIGVDSATATEMGMDCKAIRLRTTLAKALVSLNSSILSTFHSANFIATCSESRAAMEYLDNSCREAIAMFETQRKILVDKFQLFMEEKRYVDGVSAAAAIEILQEMLSHVGLQYEVLSVGEQIQNSCSDLIDKYLGEAVDGCNNAAVLSNDSITMILHMQFQLATIASSDELCRVVDTRDLSSKLAHRVDEYIKMSIHRIRAIFSKPFADISMEDIRLTEQLLVQSEVFSSSASSISNSLVMELNQVIVHSLKYFVRSLLDSGRELIKGCGSSERLLQTFLLLEAIERLCSRNSGHIYNNEFQLLVCDMLEVVNSTRKDSEFDEGLELGYLRQLDNVFGSIQFIRDCAVMFRNHFPSLSIPESFSTKNLMAVVVVPAFDGGKVCENGLVLSSSVNAEEPMDVVVAVDTATEDDKGGGLSLTIESAKRPMADSDDDIESSVSKKPKPNYVKGNSRSEQDGKGAPPSSLLHNSLEYSSDEDDGSSDNTPLKNSGSSAIISAATCNSSTVQVSLRPVIECIDCSNLLSEDKHGGVLMDVDHRHACLDLVREVCPCVIQDDTTIAAYLEATVGHFHSLFARMISQAYSAILTDPVKCTFHNVPPIPESSFAAVSMLLRWCRSWTGFDDQVDQLLLLYTEYVKRYYHCAHNYLKKYFDMLLSINTTNSLGSDCDLFTRRKDATEKIFAVLDYFSKLGHAASITSSSRAPAQDDDAFGYYSTHRDKFLKVAFDVHLTSAYRLLEDESATTVHIRWEIASCCVKFDKIPSAIQFQQVFSSLESACLQYSHSVRDQVKILMENKNFDQVLGKLKQLSSAEDQKSVELSGTIREYIGNELTRLLSSTADKVSHVGPQCLRDDADRVFPEFFSVVSDIVLLKHPIFEISCNGSKSNELARLDELIITLLENISKTIPKMHSSMKQMKFLLVASWAYNIDRMMECLNANSAVFNGRNRKAMEKHKHSIQSSRAKLDVVKIIEVQSSDLTSSIKQLINAGDTQTLMRLVNEMVSSFKASPPLAFIERCQHLVENIVHLDDKISLKINALLTELSKRLGEGFNVFLKKLNDSNNCFKYTISSSQKTKIFINIEKALSCVPTELQAVLKILLLECQSNCKQEQDAFNQALKNLSSERQFDRIVDLCQQKLSNRDKESVSQCLIHLTILMNSDMAPLLSTAADSSPSSLLVLTFRTLPDVWAHWQSCKAAFDRCDKNSFPDVLKEMKRLHSCFETILSRIQTHIESAFHTLERWESVRSSDFIIQSMSSCFEWMMVFVHSKIPQQSSSSNRSQAVSMFYSQISFVYPIWNEIDKRISDGFSEYLKIFQQMDVMIGDTLDQLGENDMTPKQRENALDKIDKKLETYSKLDPLFQAMGTFFSDPRSTAFNAKIVREFSQIPTLDSVRRRLSNAVSCWCNLIETELLCNSELVETTLSSRRDEFFKKYCRIFFLLNDSMVHLAKYSMFEGRERAFGEQVKSELSTVAAKAKECILLFPIEDVSDVSNYARFNNICDILRAFSDNFIEDQLRGFAKNLLLEVKETLKGRMSAILKEMDSEMKKDISIISFEDVTDTLIDVKLMAINIFIFKDVIQKSMDESLLKCKKSTDGNKKIGTLSVRLNARESSGEKGCNGLAQMIIAEHQVFKGFALSLRNTKTLHFSINDVLKGLSLEPSVSAEILSLYTEFETNYWKLVEDGLGKTAEKCNELVSAVGSYSPSSKTPLISKVLYYIERIFSFWTLSNASDFLVDDDVNNDDVCDEKVERAAKRGRLKHETLMEKANEILEAGALHEVLSVEESATTADIKKSFKKLSIIFHPDKIAHDVSAGDKVTCKKAFLKIKDAYDELCLRATKGRSKASTSSTSSSSSAEDKARQARNYILQPHAAQVVSIFLFFIDSTTSKSSTSSKQSSDKSTLKFKNQLIQIGTGEGKSVTLAVTSCVLALLGFDVNCACYSDYLSRRDYAAFANIFQAFGLSERIAYNTFNALAESVINSGFKDSSSSISGGGIRCAVEAYIQPQQSSSNSKRTRSISAIVGKIASASVAAIASATTFMSDNILGRRNESRPRVLLIDEVDVFLSKDFYGNVYCPFASVSHPTITALLRYLYDSRTSPLHTLYHQAISSIPFKDCLNSFPSWNDLLQEALRNMISDLQTFEQHDYKVIDGKIAYMEHDDVTFKKRYGYKTAFAYMKEHFAGSINRTVMEDNLYMTIQCGRFSYAEIPKLYHSIMGVTGTLSTLSESEKKLLREDVSIEKMIFMPSIFGPNQLQFSGDSVNDVKIVDDVSAHYLEIVNEIKNRLIGHGNNSIKRAVLVFFKSVAALHAFMASRAYAKSGLKDQVHLIEEKTKSDEKESLIRHAATSNAVTLLTRAFGRGTDFVCYDEKLQAAGGVHVISTFLSEGISEETQIRGRTARQGNQGSFSMVLLANELELFAISRPDIERMVATKQIYKTLHDKRLKHFEVAFPESMRYVAEIKDGHVLAQNFVQSLLNGDEAEVRRFLVENNQGPVFQLTKSRTICLMDATGSMMNLLQKCKNCVQTMFQRAYEVLRSKGLAEGVFELQFAVYRNYNSTSHDILQKSTWESKPEHLKTFMDSIHVSGGIFNEAVEIGFAHVNEELLSGDVSQVILIGDMPPNTKAEVDINRKTYNHWGNTKYSVPTYYKDELEKMKLRGVVVHAFYVQPFAKAEFEVIAQMMGGTCSELDINSPQGADILTAIVTEYNKS